ncbi:DMT family transporter [Kitasatospora sp. NPDC047058]|uniref:DMT family transporter n=1 Tax=Kitasatospora sp. NPDC047058 TaxID=3155620 RepID=UPI0033CF1EC4
MTARGWFLFALMGVIWGVPYLMIKVAVEGVSASGVVFVRCVIGAALLLPFALRQGGFGEVLRRHWKPMLAFAVLEILLPWLTLTDAERRLSSSTTGLLIAVVPIIALVVTRAAGRFLGEAEQLGPRRLAGLGLGLAGVAVLTLPHLSGGDAWSLTEVLITAIGYATAPLIVARRLQDVPTLQLITPCLLLAAVVYAPAAALTWPATAPSAQVWASLAGLGVVCTALAFIAFLELIREVGPSRSVVITYLNPAVAVAAGVVFLGEPLTAGVLTAFALILAGSVLATATRSGRPAAPQDAPVADGSDRTDSADRTPAR